MVVLVGTVLAASVQPWHWFSNFLQEGERGSKSGFLLPSLQFGNKTDHTQWLRAIPWAGVVFLGKVVLDHVI
jgi:hypothetical protein